MPNTVYSVMKSLVKYSLSVYEIISASVGGDEMETETCTDSYQFWNEFQSLTSRLGSLGLRHYFLSHSTAVAMETKVSTTPI